MEATGRDVDLDHAQGSRVLLPSLGFTQSEETIELFRFSFDQRAEISDSVVPTGLRSPRSCKATESWLGAPPLRRTRDSDVHLSGNSEFLLGYVCIDAQGPEELVDITRSSYLRITDSLRRAGFGYLARAWNFVPYINVGAGDDEGYRKFCVGRALALESLGLKKADLPAATGVGVPKSNSLVIALLATRTRNVHIENPRQIPAYHYPRRYGPRSPTFARATLLGSHSNAQLLISGTASVVGHESRHIGCPAAQATETFRNIRMIIAEAQTKIGMRPLAASSVRAYIRPGVDSDEIVNLIREERLFKGAEIITVEADICRPELLVEIELVATAQRTSAVSRAP